MPVQVVLRPFTWSSYVHSERFRHFPNFLRPGPVPTYYAFSHAMRAMRHAQEQSKVVYNLTWSHTLITVEWFSKMVGS